MNTYLNVARYHLVAPYQYAALPAATIAFAFLVNTVVVAMVPDSPGDNYTGGQVALYIFFLVLGSLSVSRSLPFGFALGLSRRSYYIGTMVFMAMLAALYGAAVTVLQVIETTTAGWGLDTHFFRVPWILDGPWYLTWFTSLVLLMLMFVYGMWYGLVYRRWNITGSVVFVACQAVVLLAGCALITWTHSWIAVGHFFETLGSTAFTAILAAVAVALTIGGYATIRRITV